MSIYAGDRTIDGAQVTVDGAPLPGYEELAAYSLNGFEWSYEGPEPKQLAFALLYNHLGNADTARELSEALMRAVVANFDNVWEMTSADLAAAVETLGQRR